MIVCFLGVYTTISRFLTFACLLIIFPIVQLKLVFAVNKTPNVTKIVDPIWNSTRTLEQVENLTNSTQNSNYVCVPEIIDWTLPYVSLPYRIFAGALMVPITFCAISGNILVIYVIRRYSSLRVTGNVFLASLAFADVGVSALAMTFYGIQLLLGRWILGAFMCRLWFSCDVLFSTASIMHLACIALDRYLSIVRPFEHDGTPAERRRYFMIASCWLGSALLSFIPIFTGIYTTREQRYKINCLNRVPGHCIFAVNQIYAIVSSSFSFWVPGAVMIIIYVMLIRIADKKEREAYRMMDSQRRRISTHYQYSTRRRSSDEPAFAETIPMTQPTQRFNQLTPTGNGHYNKRRRSRKKDSLDGNIERHASVDLPGDAFDPRNSKIKQLRRERRAVKTLGAIMVAFLICWLPFFVRYTACEPNRCNWKYMPIIEDIVFWVGYFNSMINPFLYAFHNKDFRRAFEKTLRKYFVCCRKCCRNSNRSATLPPATPSGDFQRSNLNRSPKIRLKRSKKSSKKTINQQKTPKTNNVTQGNNGADSPNGNVTGGENSTSSKRNSCL